MPGDAPPRSLRHVRQSRSTFDACFFERHSDFWPIARAASCFGDRADWPDVTEYGRAFEVEPPVRFEPAPVSRRRPAGPIVRADLYDAMITLRRIVPTRSRMWHDYLNALVWATFPRAKLAFHRRQHVAIERWIPAGATQLPNARTRELDALALVDEGGVLVLDEGDRQTAMIFGHALFEGLVLGQPAMVARAVILDAKRPCDAAEDSNARETHETRETRETRETHETRTGGRSVSEMTTRADALLAQVLNDTTRIVSPDELPRLPLHSMSPPDRGLG